MVSFLVIGSDNYNYFAVCDWEKVMHSDIAKTCALVREAGGKYIFSNERGSFTATIVSFDLDIKQDTTKSKQAFEEFISFIKGHLCSHTQLRERNLFLIEEGNAPPVYNTPCEAWCKGYLYCKSPDAQNPEFSAKDCPGLILRK
jgi:hypothetical protein